MHERPVVLIPWRPGCPHRARALDQVTALYHERHPDWPVILGRCDDGPWVKALAIADGLSKTDAGVLILADADVWTEGLAPAVEAVQNGTPWAVPHDKVRRLAEDGQAEDERPYRGIEGGGIVVLRRDVWLDCPMDPRFKFWGQEDESFGVALTCLYGPPWRGTADLTHHWHPPQQRGSRTRGNRESWQLRRRYFRAGHDLEAMRALIGEATA